MRLVAANLRPIKLDDFIAASSMLIFVHGIGIDPDAVPGRIAKAIAAIPDTKTGQAADAWHFASPIGRAVRFRAGDAGKRPPQALH
jgi:hypothetical protein